MSRSLEKAEFDDDLFNDWRIQHFHFYERPARSGDVVFAIVQPDDFYIIGVFPHRQWHLREILERVHRNWPEVIVRNRVHNVLGTESGPLSDAEIDARRKAGIVSLLELSDGSVYFPPGGGITSARTSIETSRYIQFTIARLSEYASWLRANADEVLRQIVASGRKPRNPIAFRLLARGNDFFALEVVSKSAFPLGPFFHERT